jgi:hypothetical protein
MFTNRFTPTFLAQRWRHRREIPTRGFPKSKGGGHKNNFRAVTTTGFDGDSNAHVK